MRRERCRRCAHERDPRRLRRARRAAAPAKMFIVRKERKEHGLQRWIEGPPLDSGERCLIVEDVVTTGGSTIEAVERVRSEGLTVAGVVSVLDRLAGGGEAIQKALGDDAPYVALSTIDEVYPDRPDRRPGPLASTRHRGSLTVRPARATTCRRCWSCSASWPSTSTSSTSCRPPRSSWERRCSGSARPPRR